MCVQRGRKAREAGEGAPRAAPQWKVLEVRGLEEALLQHGEDRTATTRRAVSAPSRSHAHDQLCIPRGSPILQARPPQGEVSPEDAFVCTTLSKVAAGFDELLHALAEHRRVSSWLLSAEASPSCDRGFMSSGGPGAL